MNPSPTFPESFVTRMHRQLGNEAGPFFESLEREPRTSRRWNPFKAASILKQPFDQPVPWCGTAEYLANRIPFIKDPRFHAGAYYVQESSSMFMEQLVKAVGLQRPVIALDLCASPGGKSTHLLSLLPPGSLLVANEAIRNRVPALIENITRWGNPNAIVTNNDPEDFRKLAGFFDLVLVDAPCSGEGLFRKDAKAVKEWSPDHVHHCALRQRRILEPAWAALKEEGVLLYSTCTFNEDENEKQIEQLRQGHAFEPVVMTPPEDWSIVVDRRNGFDAFRFYPHRTAGEGLVMTALRKKESETNGFASPKKAGVDGLKKETDRELRTWLMADDMLLQRLGSEVIAFPEKLEAAAATLSGHLNIVQKGTTIAVVKHGKAIPAHGLALSPMVSDHFHTLQLDEATAIRYLRKESLPVDPPRRGYVRIAFGEWSLGWAHAVGTRMNNLYPKNQRILMR